MSDPKIHSASALSLRGMNVIAVARFWGVSSGTFRKFVRLGVAPAALKIPEIDRNILDREAIDAAMSARAGHNEGGESKLDAVLEAGWREFIATCDELAWDNRLVLEGSAKAAVLLAMRGAWDEAKTVDGGA
jgi:hypothetical protein